MVEYPAEFEFYKHKTRISIKHVAPYENRTLPVSIPEVATSEPVFVHRMITEHTAEASIQNVQARKQAPAAVLFEGSGKSPLPLTEEDVRVLFEPG